MKIYTYTFPSQDLFQWRRVENAVELIGLHFDSNIITKREDAFYPAFGNTILIFFVTSVEDFRLLAECNFREDNINIIYYFLYQKEFNKITPDLLFPLEQKHVQVVYSYQKLHSLVFPGRNKIIDTIIHNTTGTKYHGVQAGQSISAYLNKDMAAEFDKIRELGAFLKKHNLNPDPYAGAIAMRVNQGMLITAHHTDKYNITDERICYIAAYDQNQDFITWIGPNSPSSETSIAWLAFNAFRNANFLLHFHYKPITYSNKLKTYRTRLYEPYGTYAEAKAVVNKLGKTEGFAIAKGHGELIIDEDIEKIEQKILLILRLL